MSLAPLVVGCAVSDANDLVDMTPSRDGEDGEQYTPFDAAGKIDGLALGGPIHFGAACEPGDRLTIAAVGDILLHGRLQKQAFASADRYHSLWPGVRELLSRADVTYANLEGPTAAGVDSRGRDVPDPGLVFDNRVYTSYPMFNYHPSLLDDLVTSGVDVVSTANNHSLDRRGLGADRTIDALQESGIAFTGTRRRREERAWHAVTEHNGFRLAWLACTYGTNGIPDNDDQVLFCFRDAAMIEGLVSDLSTRSDVDAVLVTPHWGAEYQASPNRDQTRLAHRFLEAGALAILGSHPHVLQPWERYETSDGRETFAIYSLGNFVSGQRHLPRRSTLLLYLGLTRGSDGVVRIHGARYVPLHMTQHVDGRLELQVIDAVGGLADSRDLTTKMFGHFNVLPPDAPLVLDPQCDPAWQPPVEPHGHDGWIGGACDSDGVCGGAYCLDELEGGLCSMPCSRYCPDRAGHPSTFCVDLGVDGTGSCVAQCARNEDCREGYACLPRGRFGDPTTSRPVCVPAR